MEFGSHSIYQFQGAMTVLLGAIWAMEIPALYSEGGIAKTEMLRTDR